MAKTITLEELTPKEKAELRAAVAQGEADYAAGNFLTLERFKAKHAEKLPKRRGNVKIYGRERPRSRRLSK